MTYFLRHVRKEFPDDYILMIMDGAPCHKDGAMDVPKNMIIQRLPPYSPELQLCRKYLGRYAGEVFWKYRVR